MTKARDLANGGFGLVLIKPSTVVNGTDNGKGTVSFSAVGSVSLNNVFSSTYDNYRIMVTISTSSNNDGNQFIRMRNGGSDKSTNTYVYSSWVKAAAGSDLSYTSGTDSLVKLGAQDNVEKGGQSYCIDIVSPFLAQFTRMNCNVTMQNDGGAWGGGIVSGLQFENTSFDGFTLHTQNGTFTGTVSVYGYNK